MNRVSSAVAVLAPEFPQTLPLVRGEVWLPPPESTWVRRTHERSVSLVIPHFEAIDVITAHPDGYPSACSSTSRTARTRTSDGVPLSSCHRSVLSRIGVSNFPGAVDRATQARRKEVSLRWGR